MSNYVLIPGGMLGGWCWKKVLSFLPHAYTPTLTGLGEKKHLCSPSINLTVHINDVVNMILYEQLEEVVLVGHSYGGMVIGGVAELIPDRIQHLIYLDGVIPEDGKSLFDVVDPEITEYLRARAQQKGDGWLVPPPPKEAYDFPNQEDSEWFAALSTPHPIQCFEERISLTSHNNIKKSFIKCTHDFSLNSMLDRAEEMGFACHLMETDHFPMVTEPEKLSYLLSDR